MEKIKVFIVDDDNMLIDGIAKFFRDSSSLEFYGKANNPVECLAKLEEEISNIDIILMDVKFPKFEMDGIHLARRIRELHPGKTPKIVFTTIGERALVDLNCGFHGLIPKNQGILELMNMLENIHFKSTIYYPPQKSNANLIDQFTQRQKKIFCMIVRGVAIEKIAQRLNITANIVRSHEKVIISKIQQLGFNVQDVSGPEIQKLVQKHQLCGK